MTIYYNRQRFVGSSFYKTLILGFFVFASAMAKAQISDGLYKALPDSLRPKDKKAVTLVEKQRLLLYIFDYYLSAPTFKRELESFASELDNVAAQTSDNSFRVKTLCALGNYNSFFNNGNQAKSFFLKTVDAIGSSDKYNVFLCGSYSNLARQYYISKDKDDSTIYFLHKLLQVKGVEKDSTFVAMSYDYYSQIYNRLQLYEEAIHYNDLALRAAPIDWRDKSSYTILLLNRAISYQYYYASTKSKTYADSAKTIFYKIIDAKKEEAANWYLVCFFNLELLYYQLGDYKTSMQLADSAALPFYNKTAYGLPNHYSAVHLFKALSIIRMGYFEKGKKMLDTITVPKLIYRQFMYEALYQSAKEKHDWKAAFEYHQHYKIVSDSIDVEGQKGKIFDSEQKYSVAQKEADIAKLETRNLLQEKARRNLITIGVISLLVLTIVILLFFFYTKNLQTKRKLERQKLTDNLHQLEDEMQLHSAQAQAENALAMEEQRKTISQDMHDEVNSSMVALKYYIADLKERATAAETKQVLNNVEQETENLYQQVRTFSHQLSNTDLQAQYNVLLFLRSLASSFDGDGIFQVMLDIDETNIKHCFTALQHNELYRVIKECVANSLKHAGATQININIYFKDGTCHFSVKDNGRGTFIDITKGMGHSNLQKRLAILKGKLEVISAGDGTEVRGTFPVNN